MNDINFRNFAFASGAILLLWWIKQRKNRSTQQELVPMGMSPEEAYYSANPRLFDPTGLVVNVTNMGYNPYGMSAVPLFGFVGMAQGSLWE